MVREDELCYGYSLFFLGEFYYCGFRFFRMDGDDGFVYEELLSS